MHCLNMLTSGEKRDCKLLEELNVTQPTLSHHMKNLCDSGIVVSRKQGKWMHYSISDDGAKIAKILYF
ncbi:MAG: metalloregulator ArsR/SmtB family transcription factor [Acutalibacteraceae bacterium]|nr:metalloregulator ArsR/SmtB family transcription factor [Acutalibacteraceae bacterium]